MPDPFGLAEAGDHSQEVLDLLSNAESFASGARHLLRRVAAEMCEERFASGEAVIRDG
jgi:hypothetical protein